MKQMHPLEVKNALASGDPVVLIDVREPQEYAICRIEGSSLIPLGELVSRAAELEIPDGALVICYCHHGVRSLSGAAMMQRAGHANVASMTGGIEWWSQLVDPSVPRY